MAPLRGRKTDVSVGDDEITTALGLNSDLSVSIDQWADELIATDTEVADNNENNEPTLRADISPAESKFAAKLMEEISKGAKDSQSAPAQKMCRAMDEAENTHYKSLITLDKQAFRKKWMEGKLTAFVESREEKRAWSKVDLEGFRYGSASALFRAQGGTMSRRRC